MSKRTKNSKTYRVRVVNPAPPPKPAMQNRRAENPEPMHGRIRDDQKEILVDLANAAEESEDDWGIIQEVQDYLGAADAANAPYSPQHFLELLAKDVWYHYGHSGEGSVKDGADPMFSIESAKRAELLVFRAQKQMKATGATNPARTPATEVSAHRSLDLQRARNPGPVSPRTRALGRRVGS